MTAMPEQSDFPPESPWLVGIPDRVSFQPFRHPMSRRHQLIPVSVELPPADYHVYASAARMLTRIMGTEAPNTVAIMQAQLRDLKPCGLADDHLDSVGWPKPRAP